MRMEARRGDGRGNGRGRSRTDGLSVEECSATELEKLGRKATARATARGRAHEALPHTPPGDKPPETRGTQPRGGKGGLAVKRGVPVLP
jgi:hypothetical protein